MKADLPMPLAALSTTKEPGTIPPKASCKGSSAYGIPNDLSILEKST